MEVADREWIRPWDTADWTEFSRQLALDSFHVPDVVDQRKINKLYTRLNHALDIACPKRLVSGGVRANAWYGQELKDKAKQVARAEKIANRTKLENDLKNLKRLAKEYKYNCKKIKRRSWRTFLANTAGPKQASRLVRILGGDKRGRLTVLSKNDGTFTELGKNTAEHLVKSHFPNTEEVGEIRYNLDRKSTRMEIEDSNSGWINMDRLTKSFEGFEVKKSPGPDELKPVIFKHLPPNVKEFVLFIYKANIKLGFTPTLWKETKVGFLPKHGKTDFTNVKAFRPISLSNYLLKALERLCCWRMQEALKESPLHDKQHGFRTDRSTETAISNMTSYIEKHLMKRRHCVAIFLDITAAFDSICPDHVRRRLLEVGGDPELVMWYYEYMKDRRLNFEINGHKTRAKADRGFPQGGVCSALFWVIAFQPSES